MKQPLLFRKLLNYWTTMPKMLDAGIANGDVTLDSRPGFVPLKRLSPISDVFPPQAYAYPGFANVYNKEIMRFRRREAFSAFWSRISKSELYGSPEISGDECGSIEGRGLIAGTIYRAGEAGAQATAQSERTRPWLAANRFQAISQASMISARLVKTELASQWLRK
jgi:hypothetical protein